jgi:hypothetical protein
MAEQLSDDKKCVMFTRSLSEQKNVTAFWNDAIQTSSVLDGQKCEKYHFGTYCGVPSQSLISGMVRTCLLASHETTTYVVLVRTLFSSLLPIRFFVETIKVLI